jgi:hypothetical protein
VRQVILDELALLSTKEQDEFWTEIHEYALAQTREKERPSSPRRTWKNPLAAPCSWRMSRFVYKWRGSPPKTNTASGRCYTRALNAQSKKAGTAHET